MERGEVYDARLDPVEGSEQGGTRPVVMVNPVDRIMTKKEKLLQKARENPDNLTFDEFETLLSQNAWEFSRQRGSHRLWCSPTGQPLPIQPRRDGKAKLYQIQQFLDYLEGEEL